MPRNVEMKDERIEKYCRFCEHAETLTDSDKMLCRKRGIVPSSYICRKFVYDPLKREVRRHADVPKLEYVVLDNTEGE